MRLAIIIPAYNEEASLPTLIDEIKQLSIQNVEVVPIVVNDCSTDATATIVRNLDVDLLDLAVNLGIGGAVQTGMVYAFNAGFDYAMQVDGDGQHPPKEISKMMEAFLKSECNVLIGSRFLTGEGFQSSSYRRMGIGYLRVLVKLLSGLNISDSTSGFRLYDRKAIATIKAYYPDEYPEPEAIIYFKKRGLKISEIPVLMESRQGGKTSISFINSIYYFWKVSLGLFFSYLKS